MADTDIRVTDGAVFFTDVPLTHPLILAGGVVDSVAMATVTLTVVNRAGHRAQGIGAAMLSVPWSWPAPGPITDRDAALRELTVTLAAKADQVGEGNPFLLWQRLAAMAQEDPRAADVPSLARMLCVAAIDNAAHDGWSRAAGAGLYELYAAGAVADACRRIFAVDLGPSGYRLGPARRRLPVQHVVGLADAIDADSPLGQRIRADGVRELKVKLSGDAEVDLHRTQQVLMTAQSLGGRIGLALDPNEGYPTVDEFDALLAALSEVGVLRSVRYIEQPVPRSVLDLQPPAGQWPVPTLADEGLTDPTDMPAFLRRGWSGAVIKASKGQSFSILCHAYARARGAYVTVQDLTAVDIALLHSARLASQLPLSYPAFECNSLQYAPDANETLASRAPDLLTVRSGSIGLDPPAPCGLY
ncbi:MAG: hypothetical protein BGO26_00650 [Actinobacteria bacterium 69-20]|jgi:L-alanine-DL-glutamate epimerase-like enolase superfamily enzyme|nr:hypothetical protein [Actinomycetota bacterium]OJV28523.1 MAG: hypothetical protein BGO26_00650 [Actinobacteria bacterium 69-20]